MCIRLCFLSNVKQELPNDLSILSREQTTQQIIKHQDILEKKQVNWLKRFKRYLFIQSTNRYRQHN